MFQKFQARLQHKSRILLTRLGSEDRLPVFKWLFRLCFIVFIFIGVLTAMHDQVNSLFDVVILCFLYVVLIISPILLGRFGARVAFNTASLISIALVDFLYKSTKKEARHFHQKAITDELTGIFNRRYFEIQLKYRLDLFLSDKLPLNMLILDVDYFKDINDSYGHDMGDKVLKAIADILQKNVRDADIACRIGGDEFAIILRSNRTGAINLIVKMIQEELSALNNQFLFDSEVTISIGGACAHRKIKDKDDLFKASDSALYKVKCAGRNNSRIASSYA